MHHLQPGQKLFISEDLVGYSDVLVQDGTVPRRVDLLLLGFSYAVNNNLPPAKNYKRHELLFVSSIEEFQLPLEAVAAWYLRQLDLPEFADEKGLLEFVCSVGISGVNALKQRWDKKSKSQIQWDIMQMVQQQASAPN